MKKGQGNLKWYDNGNALTTFIIGIILLIIVCSQSFAVMGESSLALFGSVINHNTVYFCVLIYFVLLKFKFGKKYFNYINVFLMFIYFLITITSFLTILQSLSLNTVIVFIINFVFLIYLIHTMFRDTNVWKEFNLSKSPFNELGNDWYFYTITIVSALLLIVNLISTVVFSGVVISILDFIYTLLFARYIYLYRNYLDVKKKNSNNKGNFNEIKKSIREGIEAAEEKVTSFVEDNKLDEKFENVLDKVDEAVDKTGDFIEKKFNEVKTDVMKTTNSKTKKKGDKK